MTRNMKMGSLLVVDAVLGDQPAGSLYRLSFEDLNNRQGPTLSPHEIGLTEMLGMASALNRLPSTLIIGVQPETHHRPGEQLTEPLQRALPVIVRAVVQQLRDWGADVASKSCSGTET